jgi:hypothetical protein
MTHSLPDRRLQHALEGTAPNANSPKANNILGHFFALLGAVVISRDPWGLLAKK